MKSTFWSIVAIALLTISSSAVHAQHYQPNFQNYQLNRLFYYPHHYFPHNYWPTMSPRWPEPPGMPYMPPPSYMAYPPFREPGWRYEMWQPQKYYRGSHFWLDVF